MCTVRGQDKRCRHICTDSSSIEYNNSSDNGYSGYA